MTHTLLLRLAGPMQAWGTSSRFSVRECGTEPSKSGVIGLVCAALGRPRSASVDDLAALRMGVRADEPGRIARDYHTAGGSHRRGDSYGVVTADGKRGGTVVSSRYYLADADFLVGLEGNHTLLAQIAGAVERPQWALFLGRKSFVPSWPIHVANGLVDGALEPALTGHAWRPRGGRKASLRDDPEHLLLVVETEPHVASETRRDQPVGAAFETRQFATRYVRCYPVPVPAVGPTDEG